MYLDRCADFQFPNNLYLLSVTSISYILSAVSKILYHEDRCSYLNLKLMGAAFFIKINHLHIRKQSNFTFICQQGKRNYYLENKQIEKKSILSFHPENEDFPDTSLKIIPEPVAILTKTSSPLLTWITAIPVPVIEP